MLTMKKFYSLEMYRLIEINNIINEVKFDFLSAPFIANDSKCFFNFSDFLFIFCDLSTF